MQLNSYIKHQIELHSGHLHHIFPHSILFFDAIYLDRVMEQLEVVDVGEIITRFPESMEGPLKIKTLSYQ